MTKSSMEYAELSGLNIAMSILKLTEIDQKDEEWIHVTNWMNKRINELAKK